MVQSSIFAKSANAVKTVGLISKPGKPELSEIVPELTAWLKQRGYRVTVDAETGAYGRGEEVVARAEIGSRKPDFVIVLGGDGTLLAAARAVARADVPILGVNIGSLGFLTEVPLDELYPTLEALERNQCAVERRAMLRCQLVRGDECLANYEALNDVVVSKSAIARIADYEVRVDGAFVSSFKADGMIVSTPTGSTAYALAAGGPLVAPSAAVFILSPVSPHALTHRPMVVPDTAEIAITVTTRPDEAYLTIDGQVGTPLIDGDRILCRKSQYQVKLLRLAKRSFFEVLRTKLKWGER